MLATVTHWRGKFGFAKRSGGGEFFIHVREVVSGREHIHVGSDIECEVAETHGGLKMRPEGKRIQVRS